MKHFGDITKIRAVDVPPVNVVIGGSPCQDLSVAGKQAGMTKECENHNCDYRTAGNTKLEKCPVCGAWLRLTRSGLFMEQVRIIKEMRRADTAHGRTGENIRPRFMVWENVPGAFSSHKGADFSAVLQETARVVCEKAPAVPIPKNGWPTAGCITGMGDGGGRFSIAWRVLDAQFWGVPQRRRRIALVADFTGLTAPEILFERYGVQGDLTESGTPREKAAGDTDNGVTTNDSTGRVLAFHLTQNPISGEIAPCLSSGSANGECVCGIVQPVDTICIQGNCIDRADTAGCNGKGWTEGVSYTLNTIDRHAVCVVDNHPQDSRVTIAKNGIVQTLNSQMGTGGGNVPIVISIDRAAYNQGINAAYDIGIDENGIAYTAVAKGPGAVAYAETSNEKTVYWSGADVVDTLTANNAGGNQRMPDKQNFNCVIDVSDETQYIVRRLTPLECERLQGFPDGWTDIAPWTDSKGKVHKDSDSARYKALGNSIAIPPWLYVLKNLTLACGADTTMASLFDGIGGFPLIWEYLNGKGSCVWASEIEEFCIAVTKQHFGDVVYQTTTATQQEEATDDFKS